MTSNGSITTRLITVIGDVFMIDPARLNPKMSAIDVPGWDSVSQVGLALSIEDEFGITMEPEQLNDIPDIAGLAEFVTKRLPPA